MPHMFINRPRLHSLTKGRRDLKTQFRWETINAVLYKIGGFLFIIGSILFFPRFEAYVETGIPTARHEPIGSLSQSCILINWRRFKEVRVLMVDCLEPPRPTTRFWLLPPNTVIYRDRVCYNQPRA